MQTPGYGEGIELGRRKTGRVHETELKLSLVACLALLFAIPTTRALTQQLCQAAIAAGTDAGADSGHYAVDDAPHPHWKYLWFD